MLPAHYARDHVRLGYAATEPGNQSDTQDRSVTLATGSTTGRGLYVGMTRGRGANHVLVVTDTNDLGAARDLLERVITCDRADVPAMTRRRQLVGVGSDRSTEVSSACPRQIKYVPGGRRSPARAACRRRRRRCDFVRRRTQLAAGSRDSTR